MSLIDDAAACGVFLLGTDSDEDDLARLRAMWLKEDREDVALVAAGVVATSVSLGQSPKDAADTVMAAIRALPLDHPQTQGETG